MSSVITVGDKMMGHVKSHNSHIVGYQQYISGYKDVTNNDGTITKKPIYSTSPIYCNGHDVVGTQITGVSKFKINGKDVVVVGSNGVSNCPCDGKGYNNLSGSSKFKIGGIPVVRSGDSVNIHSQGTGYMMGGIAKFNILY